MWGFSEQSTPDAVEHGYLNTLAVITQEKCEKTHFSTKQPSYPDSVPHQGHNLISSEL